MYISLGRVNILTLMIISSGLSLEVIVISIALDSLGAFGANYY